MDIFGQIGNFVGGAVNTIKKLMPGLGAILGVLLVAVFFMGVIGVTGYQFAHTIKDMNVGMDVNGIVNKVTTSTDKAVDIAGIPLTIADVIFQIIVTALNTIASWAPLIGLMLAVAFIFTVIVFAIRALQTPELI
jgi:uncharacterized membrane protein YjgN (DUF898 family)